MDTTADKPAKEYDEKEGEDDPFDNDAFLFMSKLVSPFAIVADKVEYNTYLCVPEPVFDKTFRVAVHRLGAIIPL